MHAQTQPPSDAHEVETRPERVVRLYTPPKTIGGKLWNWRYLILRRLTQFGILAMFFGTARYGWEVAGRPLLSGNLSASEFLGVVPLADPFAVLQQLLTLHLLDTQVLIGAGIILAFYALIGGRAFCGWVCPINLVTDAAAWLRAKWHIPDFCNLSRSVRGWALLLSLVLSALLGVAAFEWVSPISMLHREIVFGVGLGLTAALGIFLFDLLIVKRGWCGHLCPLGAFYCLAGCKALLKVRFEDHSCTRCVECVRVCPEPHVLNFKQAADKGMVISGDCTNCGRCITICPENSLSFDLKPLIKQHNLNALQQARRPA